MVLREESVRTKQACRTVDRLGLDRPQQLELSLKDRKKDKVLSEDRIHQKNEWMLKMVAILKVDHGPILKKDPDPWVQGHQGLARIKVWVQK